MAASRATSRSPRPEKPCALVSRNVARSSVCATRSFSSFFSALTRRTMASRSSSGRQRLHGRYAAERARGLDFGDIGRLAVLVAGGAGQRVSEHGSGHALHLLEQRTRLVADAVLLADALHLAAHGA